MTAEIISVGTELLLGDVVDTDAAFLSRELAALGINVYRRTTAGDNMDRLVAAINAALAASDLVVLAGGLGPTTDDITKEAAAKAFGVELVLEQAILDWLRAMFQGRGQNMPENNIRQAYIPEGAAVLPNGNGTAPGVFIEKNGKTAVLLPGPPNELEPMFLEHVKPLLRKRQDSVLVSRTVRMCGIGESAMETLVLDLLDNANPTVAPYAGMSETRLRITAKAGSEAEARELIKPVAAELYKRLGEYIYGEDDDTLEGVIVRQLIDKGLTLALAESCTGGMVASRLTAVPGVSKTLLEAVVAYGNESKVKRLGVSAAVLETYGAVSGETAMAMAKGAAISSGADIGLSITGIAGPGGGSAEKPVGLVYFGLYKNGQATFRETRSNGSRDRIRVRAVVTALETLWRAIRN